MCGTYGLLSRLLCAPVWEMTGDFDSYTAGLPGPPRRRVSDYSGLGLAWTSTHWPGSHRCRKMAEGDGYACQMHGCSLRQLHVLRYLPRYPDMRSYLAGGHVGALGGWRGRGERPSLWRSRRRPWCSDSAPPAFHLPGWCQPLAGTTTANICGPNQGRAVTPTGVKRGSGSAGQRPGMAAAADTRPLPVHPEAFASLTCMLL